MISMEGFFEILVIATTFLTVLLLVIGILKKKQLTSERSIERMGMHIMLLKSGALLSIIALLFFILWELDETLELFTPFELLPGELPLTVGIPMFLLVLFAIILNLKLMLSISEGNR